MRIIDRYVIRQVLMPLGIGLVVFTFVFIIDALREYVEPLVVKGVPAMVLVKVLATLLPQALALSIPMSLLLGLLVAFGRLSSDREFVAMQACGVSLRRLLVPVGVLSLLAWASTSYVMLEAVPSSNQNFREIVFNVMAERAEGEVKPRVFFDDFSNLVLYVREVPVSGGGWHGVFMADSRSGPAAEVTLARRGGIHIDRDARTVEVQLQDVVKHTPGAEGGYQVSRFDDASVRIDPASVFSFGGPAKEDNEMTIAELRQRIEKHEAEGISTHNQLMAIHRKFAIPVACLVFGVIGLALGATNRRDGALGSFGLGLIVVFAYYVPMFLFPQMTKGGYVPPWLAVWLPNMLLGLVACLLLVWRNRVADQPIAIPVPLWLRHLVSPVAARWATGGTSLLRVLDGYVTGSYLRLLALSAAAAVAVFYISTFIDLSDKLFKGKAPWYTLVQYFWYATPQFAYYILPISVLIATLVSIGMLTRNSELVVMKACGVSLYRIAAPILVCATLVGGVLFLLDATILGRANRTAQTLRDRIKGSTSLQPVSQPWMAGSDGTFYHVRAYDAAAGRFEDVDIYEFSAGMEHLVRRTYARSAVYVGSQDGTAATTWRLEDGWTRNFDAGGERPPEPMLFSTTLKTLEATSYFSQEPPDARFMNYAQLRSHTERLRSSGFDVLEHDVGAARKVAYPFVTLIMTLIGIPFAVTMGRSGTMAGIAVGIALAITYWGTINISAALGTGGLIAPMLAAWAPNVLFGAGAAYLLLTART